MQDKSFNIHYRIAKAADEVLKVNPGITMEQAITKAVSADETLYADFSEITYGSASTDTIGGIIADAYEEAVAMAVLKSADSTDIPSLEDAANSFFVRHPETFQAWLDSTNDV